MCFNWICYLELAKELFKQAEKSPNKEAKLRSSISRAYYAAYSNSLEFLKKKGYQVKRRDAHRDLINEYRLKTRKHISIAAILSRLLDNRIKADYYNNFYDTVEDLKELTDTSIDYADKIMSKLNELENQ